MAQKSQAPAELACEVTRGGPVADVDAEDALGSLGAARVELGAVRDGDAAVAGGSLQGAVALRDVLGCVTEQGC